MMQLFQKLKTCEKCLFSCWRNILSAFQSSCLLGCVELGLNTNPSTSKFQTFFYFFSSQPIQHIFPHFLSGLHPQIRCVFFFLDSRRHKKPKSIIRRQATDNKQPHSNPSPSWLANTIVTFHTEREREREREVYW